MLSPCVGGAAVIPRIAFSLGIGIAIFAVLSFILAFTAATSELDTDITLLGVVIAGAVWGAILLLIWKGRQRTLTAMLTGAGLLLVWFVTLALCFLWRKVNLEGEAFFIGGTVLAGIGISIGLILAAVRSASADESANGSSRPGAVHCPSCGYSMVGLRECTCPECGKRFTVDELFAAQG